jgi:hypothetical protein
LQMICNNAECMHPLVVMSITYVRIGFNQR